MEDKNLVKVVSMIGAGSWGTSIAKVIAENNSEILVKIWSFEKDVSQTINEKNENSKYLPNISLPKNIISTSSLADSLEGSDAVIFAPPSKAIYDLALKSKKYISSKTPVAYLTKGFFKLNNNVLTMSQIIEKAIPAIYKKSVAIYGPSHAEEVSEYFHTCLNVASKSKKNSQIFVKLLRSEFLEARITDDIIGVDVGGTLKNPAAIAAGMISELPNCGDNLSGALISEALKEMNALAKYFNANYSTMIDISGLGDLVATALSEKSRNRRFGKEVAKQIINNEGKSIKFKDKIFLKFKPNYIIQMMNKKINYLAEGAYAIEPLIILAEEEKIDIPVYRSLYEVLVNKKNPSLLIETIKNPQRFSEIYSKTKIQISDKKKGLEKINSKVFKNLIVERTFEKIDEKVKNSDEELSSFITRMKENNDKLASNRERALYLKMKENKFEKSLKKIISFYIKNIEDRYNFIFNFLFIKYLKLGNILFFLKNRKKSITIIGSFEKINKIKKNSNIIYISTCSKNTDYEKIISAVNKLNLPIPRFFVNSNNIKTKFKKFIIRKSGGFIVDPEKFDNAIYLETFFQYLSVLIEHGLPILYFPEYTLVENNSETFSSTNIFSIFIEALYKHTIEIAIVPMNLETKNNTTDIYISNPILLSDFTYELSASDIEKEISKSWNK